MNATELARMMLKWEQRKRKLEKLEEEIVVAVLELKQTQSVGLVRASYRKGKKVYDYAAAGRAAPGPIVAKFTTTTETTKTDWRKICQEAEIEAEYREGKPGVTLKLMG